MARYGRTRVCVYAVRTDDDALAAAEAGADAIAFIFSPKSSRFIEPEEAWEVSAVLPPLVATIGVFENASVEKFTEIEERCPTDYTQLHGDEPEDVVRQCGTRAIKTVKLESGRAAEEMLRWDAVDEVDAVLVAMGKEAMDEPSGKALKGVGETASAMTKPVLIGGGMTAANVRRVIEIVGPWGVVVSTGVEDDHGNKSPAKLREFVKAVRQADT